MKRLFALGCSFTDYMWPTWVDYLATKFDLTINLGQSGAGNFYIATQLYETNLKEKLTKDDTVLIMLTSFTRYDTILRESGWSNSGNLYSQTIFGKDFIEKYWSEEFGFYNTWYSIMSMKSLLDNIGCKYKFMCAFNLMKKETDPLLYEELEKPRLKNIWDSLNGTIPKNNFREFCDNTSRYYNFNGETDFHPTISDHHDWVKQELSEYYDESFEKLRSMWENKITDKLEKTVINFFDIKPEYKNKFNRRFNWNY